MPPCRIPQNSEVAFLGDSPPVDPPIRAGVDRRWWWAAQARLRVRTRRCSYLRRTDDCTSGAGRRPSMTQCRERHHGKRRRASAR